MPPVLQPEQAARVLQGEGRRGGGLQPAGLSGEAVGGRGDGEPTGGSQTEGDRRAARQERRSGTIIRIIRSLRSGPTENDP